MEAGVVVMMVVEVVKARVEVGGGGGDEGRNYSNSEGSGVRGHSR